MPMWLVAGWWGFVAGAALLLGAAAGYLAKVPRRVIASIMGFGAGVLISALAFDLMDEAYRRGGFDSTSIGFIGGAAVYTAATWYLDRHGAKNRKRSGTGRARQPSEQEQPGSGMALAIGALIDGIPESIAIGLTLVGGGAVSIPAVVAIFLSNLPEGLSSSAGMRRAGRSATFVFGLWVGVVALSAVASMIGYALFSRLGPEVMAATTAVAAGGILCMLADTMMPEAYEEAHGLIGLITVAGFLAAFVLQKLGS